MKLQGELMAGLPGFEPGRAALPARYNLAGPRGIEPLLRVLETPGLPLTYGPIKASVGGETAMIPFHHDPI